MAQSIQSIIAKLSRRYGQDWLPEYLAELADFNFQETSPWEDNPVSRILLPENQFPASWRPRWADHTVLERREGRPRYVCHPYELDPGDFADFQRLEAEGWNVRITGYSEYHPTAIRVEIYRPEPVGWPGSERSRELGCTCLPPSSLALVRGNCPVHVKYQREHWGDRETS